MRLRDIKSPSMRKLFIIVNLIASPLFILWYMLTALWDVVVEIPDMYSGIGRAWKKTNDKPTGASNDNG